MMSYRVPICFLLFALALSQISADESETTKEFVLTLDHSNFSDTVIKHDFIVLEFYAPWCGHCKKLAPEYEKAASILSSHDPPIVLAKIDANDEKNKELANQYDVRGYPTIKIVRSGGKNIQEYKGPREADGIVDYLKKQSGPASTEIKSTDDASALIGENKVAIVGIFPKFSGEEYENFTALSEKLRSDYDFGHTLDAKHLPRGFGNAVGKFFSSPIEFLSGKSCSMWTNMGPCLLHRKFLHFQSTEAGHGFCSALWCSVVLLSATQIGRIRMHWLEYLQSTVGMLLFLLLHM